MGLIDIDIGKTIKDIREAITGEAIKDPQKIAELHLKLNALELEFLKQKSQIIQTEAKSEHFLTSTWRPITMLVFVFIIFNNYVLVPYANAFGAHIPTLELTQNMWDLLKIGIGGYVVGRSAEKIAKNLKGIKNG